MATCATPKTDTHKVNFVDLDSTKEYVEERFIPIKDLKQVWIGTHNFQMPNLGTYLKEEEEK